MFSFREIGDTVYSFANQLLCFVVSISSKNLQQPNKELIIDKMIKTARLEDNYIVQENAWDVFYFLTIHTNREFFRFSFMTVFYLARALTYNKMLFYNRPCFYLVSLTTRCLSPALIIQFLSFTGYIIRNVA